LVNDGLFLIVVLMTLLLVMFLYAVIAAPGRCRSRRSARAQYACACTARAGPRTAGQAATGPVLPAGAAGQSGGADYAASHTTAAVPLISPPEVSRAARRGDR
ncbi:MAG TPA: hypothetical protein VIV12_25130, partial [Streptosporangiaceae bacterium]